MFDLPPADPGIEFVLATTGISKGLAQTEDEPQLLVRGELAFGAVYAGAYAKNVTSATSEGEAAALLGLRRKLGGFDLAGSAAWKRAIAPAQGFDKDALEMNASASRAFGRLTPKLSVVWSPDDLGSTRKTIFAEAGATYKLSDTVAFGGAVGRRERSGGVDYTAYNAGIAWAPLKPLTVDVRYYDTNRGQAHQFAGRVVGSVRARF